MQNILKDKFLKMILIIDNKGQYVHRIKTTLRDINVDSEIVENTIEIDEILKKEPEGIILSGGPGFAKNEDDIKNCRKILELEIPILGICLGHQIIAYHFGGDVKTSEHPEYGNTEIFVDDEDEIFKNMKKKFNAWASHRDEVVKIPENFVVLAHSNVCKYEAIKHKNKKIYGVQFHPEVVHTEEGYKIFENFVNLCKNQL